MGCYPFYKLVWTGSGPVPSARCRALVLNVLCFLPVGAHWEGLEPRHHLPWETFSVSDPQPTPGPLRSGFSSSQWLHTLSHDTVFYSFISLLASPTRLCASPWNSDLLVLSTVTAHSRCLINVNCQDGSGTSTDVTGKGTRLLASLPRTSQ